MTNEQPSVEYLHHWIMNDWMDQDDDKSLDGTQLDEHLIIVEGVLQTYFPKVRSEILGKEANPSIDYHIQGNDITFRMRDSDAQVIVTLSVHKDEVRTFVLDGKMGYGDLPAETQEALRGWFDRETKRGSI